jgi:hypothetical protein
MRKKKFSGFSIDFYSKIFDEFKKANLMYNLTDFFWCLIIDFVFLTDVGNYFIDKKLMYLLRHWNLIWKVKFFTQEYI